MMSKLWVSWTVWASVQWTVVGVRKHCPGGYMTDHVLFMWVASCGLQNNLEKSQFGHKGLVWWGERHHPAAYDVQDCVCSEAGWSSSWGSVCGQQADECVAQGASKLVYYKVWQGSGD